MTCSDVLNLVEPIAAGDLTPDAATRVHIETCPRCASALATARRIESALASRPAPPAPERFTAGVQYRIRRQRWQAEEHVDRVFNAAMAVAALLVVAGGAFLLNVQAVFGGAAVVASVIRAVGSEAIVSATPWLGTYVAGTALLGSAVAMWWWAERA